MLEDILDMGQYPSPPPKLHGEDMDEKNKIIDVKTGTNEFEVGVRLLGNELIGIRLASTNASGKMIL